MNRTRTSRRMREKKISRWLMIAFAAILFLGVCWQITMMARLSGQNKRVVETQKEIRALSASADNLNLSLNQYHNLERIALRAQQLGMQQPDETQLRVVNLPGLVDSTSTRSAENTGAEEIID